MGKRGLRAKHREKRAIANGLDAIKKRHAYPIGKEKRTV